MVPIASLASSMQATATCSRMQVVSDHSPDKTSAALQEESDKDLP